jgi:hypothetical protein
MSHSPTRSLDAMRELLPLSAERAETGALHPEGVCDGQRESDLEIARVNVAGELLDLQAGGTLDDDIDPVQMAQSIVESYRSLWDALTGQGNV